MLQKSMKKPSEKTHVKSERIFDDTDSEASGEQKSKTSSAYRWGESEEHPPSIGKESPHPSIQMYEANLPYLTGMVLNIFAKDSNGDGGLMMALEVPSPCGSDSWMEVDRSLCSSRYPCSLRLAAGAVRGSEKEDEPTVFRTRVIKEHDDYLTDFMEYKRISLDHDADIVIAHEKFKAGPHEPLLRQSLKFSLSSIVSAGALTVTPVIQGATPETVVTMRIRQPEHKVPSGYDASSSNEWVTASETDASGSNEETSDPPSQQSSLVSQKHHLKSFESNHHDHKHKHEVAAHKPKKEASGSSAHKKSAEIQLAADDAAPRKESSKSSSDKKSADIQSASDKAAHKQEPSESSSHKKNADHNKFVEELKRKVSNLHGGDFPNSAAAQKAQQMTRDATAADSRKAASLLQQSSEVGSFASEAYFKHFSSNMSVGKFSELSESTSVKGSSHKRKKGDHNDKATSSLDIGVESLAATLNEYRAQWATAWRSPSRPVQGCGYEMFEVVADQLYPGEVELEVLISGGDNNTFISDVLVTTRASWSEAEISLLDTVLKDHFGYFNDPEVIVHGLAMDAYRGNNPKRLPDTNPTSWGYAMESWVIMAETGFSKPEEVVEKLKVTFETLETLQNDPEAFTSGLFYPYFELRSRENGTKHFPSRTWLKDIPCGDDALFYASMMMVQGWLQQNKFQTEAATAARILGRMSFKKCFRVTDCNKATNGFQEEGSGKADEFWSVPLTFNADTLEPSAHNWNVWADEGGIVAMIVALTGTVNMSQYESIVRQQQKYSPCSQWEGITVGHSAFFNSIFTLPTRSLLGFGTLFISPYYHEFAVRSVLPSFRAHQKLKKKLGADYIGPSDAMTQTMKAHPDNTFGSYAYWPPNNMYDCRKGKSTGINQCTWCKGIQYEGFDDPFDTIVPHGNMASFLTAAMMEKSQFTAWLHDTKLLISDISDIYAPGYGLEVVAPSKRTPLNGKYEGAFDGRRVYEALSHGYTILSMYEGLATIRRRFELLRETGHKIPGSYEPPKYKPLSDFLDGIAGVRRRINELLAVAHEQKSLERTCDPSDYGPAGSY